MNQQNSKILSQNLQKYLQDQDLNLSQVSNKLKINKSTLHGYLNGAVPKHIISLKKLADYFGTTLDQLIFEDISTIKNLNSKELIKFEIIIKSSEEK
ncbi:MAG: helix-turn-helix transcriptional regulator [Halobacteriovoraceae bacterium]|nr:helix-turn-helix transcriptional regulator [Halobacteriovoraceae bacterium]